MCTSIWYCVLYRCILKEVLHQLVFSNTLYTDWAEQGYNDKKHGDQSGTVFYLSIAQFYLHYGYGQGPQCSMWMQAIFACISCMSGRQLWLVSLWLIYWNVQNGLTAVYVASYKGHDQILGLLLRRKADVNLQTEVRFLYATYLS